MIDGSRQQFRRLKRVALARLRLVAIQNQDASLVLDRRVADLDVQQEAIELRLGQRIGAFLLDRVLRRHDHEQVFERIALVADRDLPFFHRFEQRRLHLGRRAVDLVGEDQVVKQRALAKLEGAFLRAVDIGAGQVGRQQVRRKLQAMKITLDALGQHLDRAGLGQSRRALDQQMPVAQQRNQHPVDQVRLADNQSARMGLELLKLFCDTH